MISCGGERRPCRSWPSSSQSGRPPRLPLRRSESHGVARPPPILPHSPRPRQVQVETRQVRMWVPCRPPSPLAVSRRQRPPVYLRAPLGPRCSGRCRIDTSYPTTMHEQVAARRVQPRLPSSLAVNRRPSRCPPHPAPPHPPLVHQRPSLTREPPPPPLLLPPLRPVEHQRAMRRRLLASWRRRVLTRQRFALPSSRGDMTKRLPGNFSTRAPLPVVFEPWV